MVVRMARKEGRTVKITSRALLARINRRLEKDEAGVMRKCPPHSLSCATLGPYYVAPLTGIIRDYGIDLEKRGREMGLLKEWEALAAE